MRIIRGSYALILSLSPIFVNAEERPPMPDPLALEQAIELIDEQHPVLLQQQLDIQRARNSRQAAEQHNALTIQLLGRLRWFEAGSSNSIYRDHDDHHLRLLLQKPLVDGGYSVALKRAADEDEMAADLKTMDERSLYTIMVMQKFFDIILADIEAARDNESMATAFVRMDRARDNHELGKISDIDLLRAENDYQDARIKVVKSEGMVRRSRQILALALNRPGQQPSMLSMPDLDVNNRLLPEFDELLKRVLANNRQIIALDHAVKAARAQVEVARAPYKPSVTAQLERAEYSRNLSSSDKWRVGLQMSVPLYDGGLQDVAVRKAQIAVNDILYQRQQLELTIRQQVRELAEQFNVLRAQREANGVFSEYRELYMDRSRALYELEVKTDLGDAMIQISESQLRDAQQRFQMALLLAQLNLLASEDVMNWGALAIKRPVASEPE